jgi:hypothetical protein
MDTLPSFTQDQMRPSASATPTKSDGPSPSPVVPRTASPAYSYSSAREADQSSPLEALAGRWSSTSAAFKGRESASALHACMQELTCSLMRPTGHSQSAAELLMQQAATTSQADDIVKQLLALAHQREDEKRRLEAQILQDRVDFTAQAKLLSQHFSKAHQNTTALQVAHDAQQGELREMREVLSALLEENTQLKEHTAALQNEVRAPGPQRLPSLTPPPPSSWDNTTHLHTIEWTIPSLPTDPPFPRPFPPTPSYLQFLLEREGRSQAEAELRQQGQALQEQERELQHARATCAELHDAKSQLKVQMKAMVRAEKELTENLKLTHQQIDEQLNTLREQLQVSGYDSKMVFGMLPCLSEGTSTIEEKEREGWKGWGKGMRGECAPSDLTSRSLGECLRCPTLALICASSPRRAAARAAEAHAGQPQEDGAGAAHAAAQGPAG